MKETEIIRELQPAAWGGCGSYLVAINHFVRWVSNKGLRATPSIATIFDSSTMDNSY